MATEEKELYKYNNGQAMVTSTRLVLGKEKWLMSSIESAELSARRNPFVYYPGQIKPEAIQGIWRGMKWFFAGGALLALSAWLAPSDDSTVTLWHVVELILAGLGLALFLWGVFIAMRAQWKHPIEEYRILLRLKNSSGKKADFRAKFTFRYKQPAERTLGAIRDALREREKVE